MIPVDVRKALATAIKEDLVREVDRLLQCGVDPEVDLNEVRGW
jgi:hypothetical protein